MTSEEKTHEFDSAKWTPRKPKFSESPMAPGVEELHAQLTATEQQIAALEAQVANLTRERGFLLTDRSIQRDRAEVAEGQVADAVAALKDGLEATQAITSGAATDWYWMAQRRRQAIQEALASLNPTAVEQDLPRPENGERA